MGYSGPSLAPFVPSPPEVIREMLKMAGLKEGETLYDLGCGDGRILVIAAQEFGAYAVGIELNEGRVREAREKVSNLGLEDKVKIIHGNILDVDISPADVVALYLTTSANEKLKPKMERELRTGTRIVSHDFTIPGWKIFKTKRGVLDYSDYFSDIYDSHSIYLYIRESIT